MTRPRSWMLPATILLAVAVAAMAVACDGDGDATSTATAVPTTEPTASATSEPTSTASPTATTPADPLQPPESSTGVAGVDDVVATILAFDGDYAPLQALVRYTEIGCTLELGAGGPPKCWNVPGADQVEGTPVSVFPFSVCELEWEPESAGVDRFLRMLVDPYETGSADIEGYGVYGVAPVGESSVWPAGDQAIVFAVSDGEGRQGAVVRIEDGAIVSLEFGCGATHPALMAAQFANQLLAPPLGGLELAGDAVIDQVTAFPLFLVEETEPRWLAAIDIAVPVGGYQTVLVDQDTVIEDASGTTLTIEQLVAGDPLAVAGTPLPWSFWRAEQIVVDDGTPSTPDAASWREFASAEFGVVFEYQTAPDGFVFEEVRDVPEPGFVVAWTLFRQSVLDATADDAFGPRGIVIEVFAPDEPPASVEAWVRETARSNFGIGPGDLESTTVGGEDAVRYQWSGLHEAVTVAVQRDQQIWMFTATYRDDVAEIEDPFEALLASVRFEPPRP